ncbi:MAG: VTT domain-containing protein [Opitutales bacterium]|nr:VTT domain-containing protein [Opitutales bacterium]
MKNFFKGKIKMLLFFAIAILVLAVLAAFCFRENFCAAAELIKDFSKSAFEKIENMPLWAYPVACFLLPIFMLPVTPVYFAAGTSVENMLGVVLLCYFGVVLNMAFCYFLSKKFADFARSALERRGVKAPKITESEGDFVFLVRMIPGNPLCAQNYLLGLSGVGFKKYMIVSMAVQAFHVSGYIYFAEGIVRGDFAAFIFGASMICVLVAAARILKRKGRGKDGLSEIER